MSIINVQCTDQTLMITSSPKIASGGNAEDYLQCIFNDDWTGYTKTAVFYREDSPNDVYLQVLDFDDKCLIPNEVLQEAGKVVFGVYGVKDTVTRTSELLRYTIVRGSLFAGSVPPEPTQEFWEQIEALCAEAIEKAENALETAETKAPLVHTHAQSDVTGLQTALDGKANSSHTHAQADVTGLVTALAGKANSSHTHSQDDVTGLQTALDGKANASHTHSQSDVTGLETALDGKANSSHTHEISDVTLLQTTLDGKSDTTHTHTLLSLGIYYAATEQAMQEITGMSTGDLCVVPVGG